MKHLFIILALNFALYSCKKEEKKVNNAPEKELTTSQKIANAHGIEHWNKVSKIELISSSSSFSTKQSCFINDPVILKTPNVVSDIKYSFVK